MLKAERQQRILARMQETNAVTVRDLAQAFSTVSYTHLTLPTTPYV